MHEFELFRIHHEAGLVFVKVFSSNTKNILKSKALLKMNPASHNSLNHDLKLR